MLTPKQHRFVLEYLSNGLNASKAALAAGYSAKTAHVQGSRLLTHAEVKAAVADAKARVVEQAAAALKVETDEMEITAARVLKELARIAFFDERTFYDVNGNLKPVSEWTAEHGAVLAGFEVIKKNAQAGDGIIDTVHKIKVWNKEKALELLAKHMGLLVEHVKLSGDISYKWGE